MTVVQLIEKLETIKGKIGDVEVKVVIESERFNTEVEAEFVDTLIHDDGTVMVGIVGIQKQIQAGKYFTIKIILSFHSVKNSSLMVYFLQVMVKHI